MDFESDILGEISGTNRYTAVCRNRLEICYRRDRLCRPPPAGPSSLCSSYLSSSPYSHRLEISPFSGSCSSSSFSPSSSSCSSSSPSFGPSSLKILARTHVGPRRGFMVRFLTTGLAAPGGCFVPWGQPPTLFFVLLFTLYRQRSLSQGGETQAAGGCCLNCAAA